MAPTRTVGSLAALAWVALVLAGCGVGPAADQPAPEATLPAGVTVELVQLRADVAPRQAQLHVTNGSDEPVTIGDVRVEDPRFAGPATRVVPGRTSTVAPGRSVDVRVQLPPVDCAAQADARPVVRLELVGDPGATQVTASASDPLGFVAPLHARECLRERVTDAAALEFTAFRAGAPGEAAALDLTVAPAGEGAATIVGVQRTNLIDFAAPTADGAYPLGLEITEASRETVVVSLPIVPSRCDPHAVQEDKRGTIFDVRVTLAGESGEMELFVGEEMRGQILSWVAAWCGFGG